MAASVRQRQVIDVLLSETVESAEATYEQIYERNAPLMLFLSDLNLPIPAPLHMAAERALNGRLRSALRDSPLELSSVELLLAA